MSQLKFIETIAPYAQQLRKEGSRIFPSIRIAQSALETGWKIPSWNNLGGYKVGSGKPNQYWKGKVVNKGTWEVYDGQRVDIVAAFRAYDSIGDFFRDQDLLFNISRYQRVREAKNPEQQAQMLSACGYATDPQYASKLISIINTYGLKKYDVLEDDKMEKANEPSSFAKPAWDWAVRCNLIDGTRPRDTLTREELAVILLRFEKMNRAVL